MNIKRQLLYVGARLLYPVPDCLMLRLQYRIRTGRKLNWSNPQRFTEKIQRYKSDYHNPEMMECVDKLTARHYVEQKLGTDKYLNTLYQACNTADEIDFDQLPNEFVIKTTDGGSGDNVYLCHDKENMNRKEVIDLVNSWRNKRYYVISREWAYKGAKQSKVIVEKMINDPNSSDGSIDDYKFLCYNGKFRYLWVDKNRYSDHRRGFWNEQLEFLPGVSSDHPTFDSDQHVTLPANIQEMIQVAEQLAKGFPFARIDLYNIEGRIIFGEITFYPWSGYRNFHPDSFDFDLGKYFELNF